MVFLTERNPRSSNFLKICVIIVGLELSGFVATSKSWFRRAEHFQVQVEGCPHTPHGHGVIKRRRREGWRLLL